MDKPFEWKDSLTPEVASDGSSVSFSQDLYFNAATLKKTFINTAA